MFKNTQIKSNLPSILTITLLILTIGILFWYGDKKINKATNINSTVIAWENLDDINLSELTTERSSKNLNLTIQNITSKKTIYKVNWLINNKVIDSQEIQPTGQKKKSIPPTKKVVDTLTTLTDKNNRKNILYQVKITWNKSEQNETLGKWIINNRTVPNSHNKY